MFLLLFTIATANILSIPYFYVEYLEYFLINGLVPLINHIYNIKNINRVIEIKFFVGTVTKPLKLDEDIKERLDKVIISLNNLHYKFDLSEIDSLPDLISINSDSSEIDSLPDLIPIDSEYEPNDSLPDLIPIDSEYEPNDSLPDLIPIDSNSYNSLHDIELIDITKKNSIYKFGSRFKMHGIYTGDDTSDEERDDTSDEEIDEETDEEIDEETDEEIDEETDEETDEEINEGNDEEIDEDVVDEENSIVIENVD